MSESIAIVNVHQFNLNIPNHHVVSSLHPSSRYVYYNHNVALHVNNGLNLDTTKSALVRSASLRSVSLRFA